MAWTTYQLTLAFVMLVTGSINTLSAAWADHTFSIGKDGGPPRKFQHPFLQACGMFLGEVLCLLVFGIQCLANRRQRDTSDNVAAIPVRFNPLIFWPAALCDMCATSLMYIGLCLTYASSFQMLRGAVIIFTALLSVAFLRRVIRCYMWVGMLTILFGLVVVGVSDVVFNKQGDGSNINGIIAGDLLIIMAQIITATQMVYEERFVIRNNVPPLLAVGLEGLFGFISLGLLLIPMYYIRADRPFSTDPERRLENTPDAFVQLANSWQIMLATFGNVVSIAFFNFCGISVTKELSATTRMVLDSMRTLVIWVVSLAVLWQPFSVPSFLMQAGGFVLLIFGMFLYNNLLVTPLIRYFGCLGDEDASGLTVKADDDEVAPLLPDRDYDRINAENGHADVTENRGRPTNSRGQRDSFGSIQ